MPRVDLEFFRLAIQLAAPSLASRQLLDSPSNQSAVVTQIANAYHAAVAAQQQLMKGP